MEHEGTVSEASWGSFDPSVPVEDSEVMAQLLGPHYFANENEQKTTMFWPHHDSNSNFDSSNFHLNCSSNYWSTRLNVGPSSSASANSFLYSGGPSYEGYYLSDPNAMPLIDEDRMVNSSLEIGLGNNFEKQSGDENVNKRKLCLGEEDEKDETSTVFSKRKSRASMLTPKRAKNSKCKKAQKSGEEDGNGELNSSGYSSEDDSNESPDINKENEISRPKKSNRNGKSRANRGSATDPQSLYARKRRERINERLKILQNLVPNGTKVDISTMLEEAVQYVKFLQLQIKLLSSDELWMYAPIAYNGMNLGLDLRIAPPQQ